MYLKERMNIGFEVNCINNDQSDNNHKEHEVQVIDI